MFLICGLLGVYGRPGGRSEYHYCEPYTKMISTNLPDARQECQNNPTCSMFYDTCARGDDFRLCNSTASVVPSGCSSILHRIGNIHV